MARMDYFKVNKPLASALMLLNGAEVGSLVKSMCDYYFLEEDSIPTGSAAFLWGMVKEDLDRQKEGDRLGD